MLINKTGDILKATEDIICHQVNVQGHMGGGLALQIAKTYPNAEQEYKMFCLMLKHNYDDLRGKYYPVQVEKQEIFNCFTQKPNFDTDYDALKICFAKILKYAKEHNKSVCMPYKYGCGIANGNWEEVETILRSLSGMYDVDISIYKLEN